MKRNKKHKFAFAAVLLSLTLLLSACSGGSSPANTNGSAGENTNAPSGENQAAGSQTTERQLTDALGHEVKVPANPERIIASYLEDHLVALGVKPVAQWSVAEETKVQNYLQYELKDIPTIPSELPYEAVLSFQPDLILVDSAEMVAGDKYEQYSKIAPTYSVGTEQNNDWREELLVVGEVLNKADEAKKALEDYDAKAKEAKEKLQAAIGEKSAAVLWPLGKSTYVVHEKFSSGDVLYRDLGLKVPAVVQEMSASAAANWNQISLEKLAELDADYIFIVSSAVPMEELLSDPIWAGLPAVKSGQIYEYDNESSWLYTGVIANSQIIDDVIESILK
ncbi:iron-hydroxamate ABC transporter substrate-binding protein [Paenibacillus bouchesdurhonensis]|uniref:iron-hydroxamate ABC transporter substrate-binding protein n=1 Tax=Paenibacillus bouchesdurhonensis TaxID=1870990 RepID=UPI000DA5FB16|nr:iron-hydroxamate ABC transporter substrate-binding protein [Paenibacillus bouchesdurhonensis]